MVAGINLAVARGEVLGLLGLNGAGKSTTMKLLCGVFAPDQGQISVCGHDLAAEPVAAKRRIGYLPEQPPLYRTATVDEYLEYCALIHRLPRDRVGTAIARVKDLCGLGEVGPRLIKNLSKGFQQRVGLAQAIVHAPDVIVLDEPTVGLDPIQIRQVRGLIETLGRDHAIVLSTHLLPEVQQLCGRALILHQGSVVHDAALRVSTDPDFIVTFRAPPTLEILRTLPGIVTAAVIGPNRFLLTLAGPTADPAMIATAAAAGGWGLRELARAQPDLERLFVGLNCADEGAAP